MKSSIGSKTWRYSYYDNWIKSRETKSVHQLILDDEIERFFKEARDGKESRTFTRLRI